MMAAAGLQPVAAREFNRVGSFSWWIYGKILHRKRVAKVTLKLFDKSVWLWRRLDRLMPWPGLSLIVAAELDANTKRTQPAAGQAVPEMVASGS